jgi:hypothetical protein
MSQLQTTLVQMSQEIGAETLCLPIDEQHAEEPDYSDPDDADLRQQHTIQAGSHCGRSSEGRRDQVYKEPPSISECQKCLATLC